MGTTIFCFENQLKVCVPIPTGTKTHTGTYPQANSVMLAVGVCNLDGAPFVLPTSTEEVIRPSRDLPREAGECGGEQTQKVQSTGSPFVAVWPLGFCFLQL